MRRPTLLRIVLALPLLGLALFCAYGFLATFEPPGWWTLRIVYATAMILLIGAAVSLLRGKAPQKQSM